MVQSTIVAAIATLNSATSIDSQIAALRELKNEAVGHDQRKEFMVRHRLLEPLSSILVSAGKATGKRRRSDVNGASTLSPSRSSWTQEDEVRLQAVLLIGTLANGGPSFIQPLLATGTPKALLDIFSADPASKLVTATLQALKSIASAWARALENGQAQLQEPLDIFTKSSTEVFLAILRQPTTSSASKQQLRLVADIIALAAVHETTRSTLTHANILDTLAALLVSHSVANKHVEYHGESSSLPPPPPTNSIPSILSAICAIIADSAYRAYSFFLSPAIRDLFLTEWQLNNGQRYLFGPKYGFSSRGDPLLPPLHIPASHSMSYGGSTSKAFPALGSLQNSDRRTAANFNPAQQGADADHVNAVCGWLTFYARSMHTRNRLISLRLLALVNNAINDDLINHTPRNESLQKCKEREKQLCVLAIPLAVQLVQIASEGYPIPTTLEEQQDGYKMREEACDVLALLIRGKKELQAAAIDAGAIKYVCPILRKSFDNVTLGKPMWKSRADDQASNEESCLLGERGMPQEIIHAMHCRKSALEAVAALAAIDDAHRKAIVESGVVSCIVDSMKAFPAGYFSNIVANRGLINPKDGNTVPVILAACHAALSMSRSVAALRTSLIDAGLGKPIFPLLVHEDLDVQIAATNVCTNLVLEFSALREDFLTEGVIKTLAEHARSDSAALRLPSLWALKHLVLSAPKEIKISTLEQLGTDWLVSAIQGQQHDLSTGGVSVGLSTPNAAGEQVDLLNPSSMDIDEPVEEQEDDDIIQEEEDGEVLYDESSSTHYQSSQLRSTLNPPPSAFDSKKYLSSVRELEMNPALQAKRDDIAVQEQALDFVRNLLNGEDCALMFEHLMAQIGSAKIFELLTSKLVSLKAGRQVYNPTEIILSTVHILTHISNALPKHRQLLIAQKPLLQAWLPHFNHPNSKVRVMSVWAVCSLTWVEDTNDRAESRQRVRELRLVGIESAVGALQHDADLDVRERVKTAIRQMEG